MEQGKLSMWLKSVIIGMGLCGVVVYALVIPMLGQSIVFQYPEFSHYYLPWLILLILTSIPCLLALVLAWKIAHRIGQDHSFSYENATALRHISSLALLDVLLFFAGNVLFFFLNMNHPGIFIFSFLVDIFGIAISVAAAALSHLVFKAAKINEEAEGII